MPGERFIVAHTEKKGETKPVLQFPFLFEICTKGLEHYDNWKRKKRLADHTGEMSGTLVFKCLGDTAD